jgi:GNAT superfamily N-acetyltransferase
MKNKCRFQAARPDDAPGIVELIREGFQEDILSMFIYGCSGIDKFVSEQIAVQHCGGETFYVAAHLDDQLAGCTEMRRLSDGLFLNYISVRPAFRSQGLARQLLCDAIRLSGPEKPQKMDLDVLESNTVARAWYQALGFKNKYAISWLTYPLFPCQDAHVHIRGFAQAQACQNEYGFSKFSIITADREFDIGRLGDAWFRLTDAEALYSPGLPNALKRLDPRRQILLLTPTLPDAQNLPRVQLRTRTFRQTIDIETLMRNLKVSKSLIH